MSGNKNLKGCKNWRWKESKAQASQAGCVLCSCRIFIETAISALQRIIIIGLGANVRRKPLSLSSV